MSYNKTVWHSHDIITAEKMQKIENQLETLSTGNNASFSPIVTNPQDGDTLVYSAAQQKWVNGVANAGGVFIVHAVFDEQTEEESLDKTWAEINTAAQTMCVLMVTESVEGWYSQFLLANALIDNTNPEQYIYIVDFVSGDTSLKYSATTADGKLIAFSILR